MYKINNIEDLIELIEFMKISNKEINALCKYCLNKSFIFYGDVDKFWFLEKLKNYKEKYYYKDHSEQPFILNGNFPFNIKDIFV